MALSETSPLVDKLVLRLEYIERTRRKVELLLAANQINGRDIDVIYAGLFTNAIIGFEAFIEDLFVRLLIGRVTLKSSIPRTLFKSSLVARSFIVGNRPYVDWLPYRCTKDRATIFFRGGRPFSELPEHLASKISHCSLIRNALVHSGRHARRKFDEVIANQSSLAPKERTPIGFLRSKFRITPIQHRFEIYTQALIDSASFLTK